MTPPSFRIVTILGTRRPGNYTGKALALVRDELQRNAGVVESLIDPAQLDLAFPGEPSPSNDAERIQSLVREAHGIVLASPEYHGSVAACAKLVIENLGFPSVLAGKPVALLGVAAGRIGAIKSLEQMRTIASHVGALVLPRAVSIAQVQQMFDEDGNCLDAGTEKAVRSVATSLVEYLESRQTSA